MRVICAGVSHHSAPLAVRERLSIGADTIPLALAELRRRWSESEFLLLGTCNRCEVYAIRPLHGHPREDALAGWLAGRSDLPSTHCDRVIYRLGGTAAVQHLFTVAAGMDSLVLGEDQIIAQLKQAHLSARSAGAAGGAMDQLVSQALHVGKHVRRETALGEGRVSVASVTADLLADQLGDLAGRCILSIGSGKMNRLLLEWLSGQGGAEVLVANRSPETAEQLAAPTGAATVAWDALPEAIRRADAVVTATAADEPILSAERLQQARRGNSQPLVLVDLAVPRDIEPAAGELPGVRLFDMDALDDIVEQRLDRRREHLEPAETIVTEHVDEYMDTLNLREVTPTIEAMYRRIDAIIEDELADARNKLSTHDDADADLEILRRTLRRSMRKIFHPAAEALRREATAGTGSAHAHVLRRLFGLAEGQDGDDS